MKGSPYDDQHSWSHPTLSARVLWVRWSRITLHTMRYVLTNDERHHYEVLHYYWMKTFSNFSKQALGSTLLQVDGDADLVP